MPDRIIDGEKWIVQRLKFLRERLANAASDDERRAIEVEIEALSMERGIMPAGRRSAPLLRRLRRRR